MKRQLLTVDGCPREYLLAAPNRPAALVIFLHGKGGTAAWADAETGWSFLAAQENFALALPEGRPPNPDQPPKFLLNPPIWNDGSSAQVDREKHTDSQNLSQENDDVAFLDAVVEDALARTGVDSGRVFLSGFSNGAGMTFRYAAERAERLAAIAPVAGHCWVSEPRPVRAMPTLFIVGSADPLIPLRGGMVRSPWSHRLVTRPSVNETIEKWALVLGCDSIPQIASAGSSIRMDIYPGPVPFRAITVEGLGHHWPGGKGQLNPRLAGQPSNAINATRVVWEFFREFL